MSEWHDFLVAQVGAAAALAGLIFVAVSLNLAKILSVPSLPVRALAALTLLVSVLILCTFLLMPGQQQQAGGCEVLAAGLVAWGVVSRMQRTAYGALERQYHRAYFPIIILGQAAVGVLALTGAAILWQGADGYYGLAAGISLSYLAALAETWVLLVEINR
jgi:modulator of FtsH protease